MIVIPVTAIGAASGRATIESRLRAAGAVTPERAVALVPDGPEETTGLDEAIGLGRVMRTASGRMFLNPAAVATPGGETVLAVLLFVLVAASILVSVVALIISVKD